MIEAGALSSAVQAMSIMLEGWLEAQAYIAENQDRADKGQVQAYGEDAFLQLQFGISNRVRDCIQWIK